MVLRFLLKMAVLALLAFGAAPHQAKAQALQVVATCGTPNGPQPAVGSANGPMTVDRNGNLCTGSAGGAAVTGTLQNAATATGNGTPLALNNLSSAIVTVNCATCSGGTTVNFEVTQDGTNWSAVTAIQLGTTTSATSTTASGVTLWQLAVSGATALRARISGYSAGTVTVTATASAAAFGASSFSATVTNPITLGPAAAASSLPVIPSSLCPANASGVCTPLVCAAAITTTAGVCTLTATATGRTAWLCGFWSEATATSAVNSNGSLVGISGSSIPLPQTIPATGATYVPLTITFGPTCVPATASNTNIVITSGVPSTGGAGEIFGWGFLL